MNRSGARQPDHRLAGLRRISALALVALVLSLVPSWADPRTAQADTTTCTTGTIGAKRYVAGGDDVPAGNTIQTSQTYPYHLASDHMAKWGYCVYNIAKNGTTSATYISGGQLSNTWNLFPDFLTLSVGEQNSPIVDSIKSCFDKIKSHDFTGGNACAAAILGNSAAFTQLTNDLTTTLQQYKMVMAGRPKLVVAVVGYPNMYPQASSTYAPIAELCQGTEDAIILCNARWQQLPPALTTLDQVIQKLNTTIQNAVQPFYIGYQGRFIFVNPYDKFKDHAMKMDVTFKLDTVCHLCGTDASYTDSHKSEKNVGSDNPWFQAGSDGTDYPSYLLPGDQINDPPVVIIQLSQTTSGMGVYPNDSGNKCISDLVWEAVKWKLGVPEALNSNICQ